MINPHFVEKHLGPRDPGAWSVDFLHANPCHHSLNSLHRLHSLNSLTGASSPVSMISMTTPQHRFYDTYMRGEHQLLHGGSGEVDWSPRVMLALGFLVGAVTIFFCLSRRSCTTTLSQGQLPAPTQSCSVVLVHANGCVHCKTAMQPFGKVASDYRRRADFYTCEASALPASWSKYVPGFPTYLCFDGAGSLKAAKTGAMSAEQIERFLLACLAPTSNAAQ